MKRLILVTVIVSFLSACGGSESSSEGEAPVGNTGGGNTNGGTHTYDISGVIDSAIEITKVCYDENDNGACDQGEPSTASNAYLFSVTDNSHLVLIETVSLGTIEATTETTTPVSIFNTYLAKRFPSTSQTERNTFIKATFFMNDVNLDSPTTLGNYSIIEALGKAQVVKDNLSYYSVDDDDAILQFVVQTLFYFGHGTEADSRYADDNRVNIDVLKKPVSSATLVDIGEGYDIFQSQGGGSVYSVTQATTEGVTQQKYTVVSGIHSAAGSAYTVNVLGNLAFQAADVVLNYWHAFKNTVTCTVDGIPQQCIDNSSRFNSTTGNFEIGDVGRMGHPASRAYQMQHNMTANRVDISGAPLLDGLQVCKFNDRDNVQFTRIPNNVTFPAGSYCYNIIYAFKSDEYVLNKANYLPSNYVPADWTPRFRGMNNNYMYDNLDDGLFASLDDLVAWLDNPYVGCTGNCSSVNALFPYMVSFDASTEFAIKLPFVTENSVQAFSVNRGIAYNAVGYVTEEAKKQVSTSTILNRDIYLLEGGSRNTPYFMAVERKYGDGDEAVNNYMITGTYYRANMPRPYTQVSGGTYENTQFNQVAFSALYPYL